MFKKVRVLLLAGIMTLGVVGCGTKEAKEDKFKVALVLSQGGVNDQSFNQSAWEGALKAKEEYGVEVSYLESKSESDFTSNIETAIDQDNDLIVGVGFQVGDSIMEASQMYPEQKFATIDSTFEVMPENLRAITFNEEQAGYVVGLVASQITKSNVVGFIGGMDIPSCSNFSVGFEKAMKEINPNSKTLIQFTNSFTDSAKAKVIAKQMKNNGADIIFTACGGGNVGVIETAREEKDIKIIGVDMPMSYMSPEYIITSALKNVGEGLKLTIKDTLEGNFNGGKEVKYDLSNNGVGYEKTDLLSDEVIEFVDKKIEK